MSPLSVAQVVLGILLIVFILIQNRGAGMGSSWGGSGEFYATRRGFEKLLFRATIITAILFVTFSFLSLIS
ncbi:MAG: preprotein translocase subunit SecG [Candidatus Blackburnbacteria bacterium]|nr:preprotein translocase subunit SecG [Candidatus Blackburnbacteria bacterium]